MNKEQRSLDLMILNLIFNAMKALSPDAFDALLTVIQTTGPQQKPMKAVR